MPLPTLLLKNVRPMGGPATDVLIRNGRFAELARAQFMAGTEAPTQPRLALAGGA